MKFCFYSFSIKLEDLKFHQIVFLAIIIIKYRIVIVKVEQPLTDTCGRIIKVENQIG